MSLVALINTEILEQFQGPEQENLNVIWGSNYIRTFAQMQASKASQELARLDPEQFTGADAANKYYQHAKDLRLLYRFWNDLLSFSEDCASKVVASS